MPFEVEDLTKALGRMPGDNQNSEPYSRVEEVDFSITSNEAEILENHIQKRLDLCERSLAKLVRESATGIAPSHHRYDQTLNKKLSWMYLLSLLAANDATSGHEKETTITGEIPRQVARVLWKEFKRFGKDVGEQYEVVEWDGGPTHELGNVISEYAQIVSRVDGEPDFTAALDLDKEDA